MATLGMTLGKVRPSPVLAPWVRYFGLRQAVLGRAHIYTPLPARADCFLEIYLADRYQVVDVASGQVHRSPRLVLVGPHTRRREDIVLSGTLEVFHIHFTATGFSRLFGIPAHRIADAAESAETVLGREVLELAERLAGVSGFAERVRIAETFLLAHVATGVGGTLAVARVAQKLERSFGAEEIGRLAVEHGLTVRHLERSFQEQVGISPKVFARLARLGRALALGARVPELGWASIALDAGFYDQSHMVREFRALTGETPAGFAALRRRASGFGGVEARTQDVAFVLSPGAGEPVRSQA